MNIFLLGLLSSWLLITFMLQGPVYGAHDRSTPLVVPFPSLTISGEIIAKGTVTWEERQSLTHEYRLKKDYLVLRISDAIDEIFVVEFEPLFISADQFHLGEKIQAHLAEDGSLISATHMD